jgi:fatty acid desaturase
VPSVSRCKVMNQPAMSGSSEADVRSRRGSTTGMAHWASVLWFIVLVLVLLFVIVIALALVLLVVIAHVIAGGLGGRTSISGGTEHRARHHDRNPCCELARRARGRSSSPPQQP